MKPAAKANPMDTLRQLPENKKCFDCQQKVRHPLPLTDFLFFARIGYNVLCH